MDDECSGWSEAESSEVRKKWTKWGEGHRSCREEWGGTASSMTNPAKAGL